MKTLTLLALSLSLLSNLYAQPEAISGTINDYAAVIAIDTCSATLSINGTHNFQSGDTILIVQMQGASFSVQDNNSFGDLTNLGSTGLWEEAVIQETTTNSIALSQSLLNGYDPDGKVQIISIPYFEEAEVEGILSPQPWDGQTGGILAFRAGALTLNDDIVASETGFRGGNAELDYDGGCTWLINYLDYRFPPNSIRGGTKGEGIGGIPVDWPRGRGAAVNGGGGGNDHNAGGGGGALLTTGGGGGENDNPSTFGCKGFGQGIGGKALPNNERLFLGGGGGAGHGNNNVATDGGNGGGIILIEAQQITTNSRSIISNGGNAQSSGGDGSGGGGSGGMILINAGNIEGTLTLSATGGNGGNANNNNSNQCFGPGGGGGGGFIRVPGSFDTNLLLQGGIPGLSINSSACAESPNGGTTGSAGLSGGPFIIPASTLALPQAPTVSVDQDTLSSCADALTLNAFPNGLYTELVWEMDTGNGFFPVPENATYSNPDAATLTINNPAEASGVLFQLLVYSNCFEPTISSTIFVAPGTLPEASFTTEIDGLSVLFENTGTIGAIYNWDFGDNSTGNGPAPNHSYVNAGIYTVTLSVTTDCGTSTTQQNITVGSAPAPDFGVEGSSTGCAPRSVSFLNQSTGTFDSLRWDFPGGTPASSTLPNPTITYESPGTFPVSITLFSAFGPQEFTIEEQVIMYTRPTAAFSYTIDGLTVTFTNLSTDATFYSWNFGDNTTSNETSPVHNFPGPGNYDVTLNASNPNCSRAATESIFLQPSSTEQSSHKGKIILSPNPASDQVCLLTNTPLFYPVIWRCYNANGQLVTNGVLNNNQSCISLEMLPAGLYYFKVNDEDRITVLPLMVR